MTRAEYDQLATIFSYKEPERLSGSLEIIKDGERIRFKGEGRLSLLNDLYVNETIGEASFRQVQMTVRNDSLDLSQERIAVGDTIVRYRFYKGPAGPLDLGGSEGDYELLLCKLAPGNKTYLSFYARDRYQIEQPVPLSITLILDPGSDLKKWIGE